MKRKYHFKIRLLPVISFTGLVILLMGAYSYSMDIGSWPDIPINRDTILGDAFCHVKAQACLFISIWAFLSFVYLMITGQLQIKRTKIYIPMAIFTLAVFISYIFSDCKIMAWYGGISRFEGTRTLLCYMVMLFYTINVVDDLRDIFTILIPTLIAVFIACMIGLTQLLGVDILLTEISKAVIGNGLDLEAEFKPGQVYQTVYNMNYVGMYLSLVIPLLIYMIVKGIQIYKKGEARQYGFEKRKLLIVIIATSVLLMLIALNVYGADSVGGVIGICAAIMFMLVPFLKDKRAKIILCGLSIFAFVAVISGMYILGKDTIKCIDYFVTGDDYIESSIDGNELLIEYNKDTREYTLKDSEGKILTFSNYKGREGSFQIDDERFKGKFALIPFEYYEEPIMYFDAFNEEFLFRMGGERVLYINPYNVDITLDKIDSVGFKGHLSAGSGRGYIWSRTIPLLKEHIFIGSGADTFLLQFPQNDYAGKYSAELASLTKTIDKPHNMYLQMFVCTGGISCIAFIIMLGMFFIKVFKKERSPFVIALAAGLFGFMVAGLFNDSTVCIMPMFIGFLGMGEGLLE